MINFHAGWLVKSVETLRTDFGGALLAVREGKQFVTEAHKEVYKNHFEFAARQCAALLLDKADARINRMLPMLHRQFSYAEWAKELETLLEAIEDDLQYERFYHYRRDRGLLLTRIDSDWKETLQSFPGAKPEIEDAVDGFASEHYTSAVFHLMRLAELGLRALARERSVIFPNKPIEWAEWQNLLDGIERGYKSEWGNAPRGPSRDAALDFYKGAMAQFDGFKDKYRNKVMHVRERYDELAAQSALNHVCDFMNGLSRKVGENTRRPIKKWP